MWWKKECEKHFKHQRKTLSKNSFVNLKIHYKKSPNLHFPLENKMMILLTVTLQKFLNGHWHFLFIYGKNIWSEFKVFTMTLLAEVRHGWNSVESRLNSIRWIITVRPSVYFLLQKHSDKHFFFDSTKY